MRITSALPKIPRSEATALITGASGHFYENLDESDRVVVVREIMSAISEAFYYLVAITAIGFITSLFLSVSTSHPEHLCTMVDELLAGLCHSLAKEAIRLCWRSGRVTELLHLAAGSTPKRPFHILN